MKHLAGNILLSGIELFNAVWNKLSVNRLWPSESLLRSTCYKLLLGAGRSFYDVMDDKDSIGYKRFLLINRYSE